MTCIGEAGLVGTSPAYIKSSCVHVITAGPKLHVGAIHDVHPLGLDAWRAQA